MQKILLLCIFSRQRSQPSAARPTAPFKTSPSVSSSQCMGLSQLQKEGLAITGKPVVLPAYCREVDTEFKCTRCNNVRARRAHHNERHHAIDCIERLSCSMTGPGGRQGDECCCNTPPPNSSLPRTSEIQQGMTLTGGKCVKNGNKCKTTLPYWQYCEFGRTRWHAQPRTVECGTFSTSHARPQVSRRCCTTS